MLFYRYWCLRIDLEAYYPPQKPFWVGKLCDDLNKLRPKRLPMSDIQIYDLLKKNFGYKKATKLKVEFLLFYFIFKYMTATVNRDFFFLF
jgi:hypothetical protein